MRQGQPERGHLLAVANQQDVADQHRVVPGLALDRREPRELRELVGGRRDQRQFAFFRQHQQQVLIGQQDELAVAVASALPLALAVLEVDAREDAAVEAEGMAVVNDEVVEVGLQPDRGPALFGGPSAGSVRDRDAAQSPLPARRRSSGRRHPRSGPAARCGSPATGTPRAACRRPARRWSRRVRSAAGPASTPSIVTRCGEL